MAQSQPHAAYAVLTHSLTGRWSYLAQTVSDISDLLQPLEDATLHHLILTITVGLESQAWGVISLLFPPG